MQAVLRVGNTSDCSRLYSLKYGVSITEGHLCAGPDIGTVTGTCVVSGDLLIMWTLIYIDKQYQESSIIM